MLPPHASSDVHKNALGPLKVSHAVSAARTHGSHVHLDAHKPKAWPRPAHEPDFVKETWVASASDDHESVDAAPPPLRQAKKKMAVQVVIDYVGHGVASDPPVLTPQLAPLEDSLVSVQSAAYAGKYEWKREESMELAVVGAIVLVVAMVVITIARRQQRAFEEQQREAEAGSHQADTENDLENGAAVREDQEADDGGVGTPESEADPTVELSEDVEDPQNKSPESTAEGCV